MACGALRQRISPYSWIATNLESILSAVVAPKIVRQDTQDEESVSGKRFVWIGAFVRVRTSPSERICRRIGRSAGNSRQTTQLNLLHSGKIIACSLTSLTLSVNSFSSAALSPASGMHRRTHTLQEGRGNPPADWVRKGPVAITRGWCFLEAAVLIAKGCTMNVVLRQEDIDSLEALLVEDLDRMVEVINTIDINEAQVTDIEDRDYIMGAMSKLPGGFEKVSQTLRTMLREWLIGEATAALNRMPEKDRGTSCLIDSLGFALFSAEI